MKNKLIFLFSFLLIITAKQYPQQSVADSLEKQLENLSGEKKVES